MTTAVPQGFGRVRRPQDVRAAGCVTSKAMVAYRILAAVTARESGILCQGQVPPVLSGGGRLGHQTSAPVTSSYLNCAWIDSPIFYKEPLYLLPVDANAAFPDSDRWQLAALNQVVHSRPGNPEICCCFGNPHPRVLSLYETFICIHVCLLWYSADQLRCRFDHQGWPWSIT